MKFRFNSWCFQPGLAPTLLTILVFPLLLKLGFWQLDRADQKSRMELSYISHLSEDPEPVDSLINAEDWHSNEWRSVSARGEFDKNNILLDNQVIDGEAGYFVITPFKLLNQSRFVLVNRGWIPLGTDRKKIPPIASPEGTVEIIAAITDAPSTGIFLGKNVFETLSENIFRVQRLNIKEISDYMKLQYLPFILRLQPESDYGFIRIWPVPGFGQEKHLGYAFQWFALAATLMVIYLLVNTKRVKPDD